MNLRHTWADHAQMITRTISHELPNVTSTCAYESKLVLVGLREAATAFDAAIVENNISLLFRTWHHSDQEGVVAVRAGNQPSCSRLMSSSI